MLFNKIYDQCVYTCVHRFYHGIMQTLVCIVHTYSVHVHVYLLLYTLGTERHWYIQVHCVHKHTTCVHIASLHTMYTLTLTHVWFSASDRSDGHARAHHTRDVEVSEMNVAARVEQHVGRLHVAMDDPVLLEVLESHTDLGQVEPDARHGKSALLLQMIANVTTCGVCVCVCVCVCACVRTL